MLELQIVRKEEVLGVLEIEDTVLTGWQEVLKVETEQEAVEAMLVYFFIVFRPFYESSVVSEAVAEVSEATKEQVKEAWGEKEEVKEDVIEEPIEGEVGK